MIAKHFFYYFLFVLTGQLYAIDPFNGNAEALRAFCANFCCLDVDGLTAGSLIINGETTSTSCTSGAVTVAGGVGVCGNVNLGCNLAVNGSVLVNGNP